MSDIARPSISDEYVWFAGEPLAQIDASGAARYYFNDRLSNPILQLDGSANEVWATEHEPYGVRMVMRRGNLDAQPVDLPGQEWSETATDIRYNVFRWYRPQWGRYTQTDPLSLSGGVNVFAYVSGRPTLAVDEFGLKCCVQSMSAKLVPATTFPVGTSKVKGAFVKSVVCAKICGDSADCSMSQSLSFKTFDPTEGWSENSWTEVAGVDPDLALSRPSKNEVCMADAGIGMIFTKEMAFPAVSLGTTTVTVQDQTGQCQAVSGKWSHNIVCNSFDDCLIKGSLR